MSPGNSLKDAVWFLLLDRVPGEEHTQSSLACSNKELLCSYLFDQTVLAPALSLHWHPFPPVCHHTEQLRAERLPQLTPAAPPGAAGQSHSWDILPYPHPRFILNANNVPM